MNNGPLRAVGQSEIDTFQQYGVVLLKGLFDQDEPYWSIEGYYTCTLWTPTKSRVLPSPDPNMTISSPSLMLI